VIDDSELEFIGAPGDYVIPRGTVIAHSHYSDARMLGAQEPFGNEVNAGDAQVIPFLADTVTSTITLADGRRYTGGLRMDFDPQKREREASGRIRWPVPGRLACSIRQSRKIPHPGDPAAVRQENEASQAVGARQAALLSAGWPGSSASFLQAAFVYFLIKYFFFPQFHYTGPDGLAGSDFVTYYLGPLVDRALGTNGSVFSLKDFRSVIRAGLVEINPPQSGFMHPGRCVPRKDLSRRRSLSSFFRHSLSLFALLASLKPVDPGKYRDAGTVATWSARQAGRLSKSWRGPARPWELLAVALLVFGSPPRSSPSAWGKSTRSSCC